MEFDVLLYQDLPNLKFICKSLIKTTFFKHQPGFDESAKVIYDSALFYSTNLYFFLNTLLIICLFKKKEDGITCFL